MTFIRLSDGSLAHVRLGKRGRKVSDKDIAIIEDYQRMLLNASSILLTCQTCGGRYYASTVDSLLTRSCLCGGELRAS